MKSNLGSRLKELRGNLSQAEMAGRLGTAQSTYSAWERGTREPDIDTILSVVAMFSVTSDWLLGAAKFRHAVPSSDPSCPSQCSGCTERDARIDKLLDLLHSFKVSG
jgi:transcriptional regulator with XRE-family HTH domain